MKIILVATSALLFLLSSVASAQPKSDGTLSGRVLLDDGQPASGATVQITTVGIRNNQNEQKLKCDEAGNFKLPNIAPGSYSIEILAPGYVTDNSLTKRIYRTGETATIRLVKGGVITGRATDLTGELLIDARVKIQRLRDFEGKPVRHEQSSWRESDFQTDDRGIYRAYGLLPGIYIVNIASSSASNWVWGESDNEVPTYYPSTTRDAAMEITVRSGDEVSGIDIRHRGENGRAISGTVTGQTESSQLYNSPGLTLLNAATKEIVASTSPNQAKAFVFFGIPDGEYELYARMRGRKEENGAGSPPQRVSVKGTDVTGLVLRLTAYGSIGGRLIVEPAKPGETKCENKSSLLVEETLVRPQSELRNPRSLNAILADDEAEEDRVIAPDEKGQFTLINLEPDSYRIEADLPGENWFVRSITLPASGTAKTKTDATRSPISLKAAEKVSGVEVTIAEGAASLSGRVTNKEGKEGGNLPNHVRVHLIPGEATAADDVLRYREIQTDKSGSFEFKQLAPGKYRLLARSIPDTEKDKPRPAAFDSTERIKLRKEAEAANNEIEVKACQRVKDYGLRF